MAGASGRANTYNSTCTLFCKTSWSSSEAGKTRIRAVSGDRRLASGQRLAASGEATVLRGQGVESWHELAVATAAGYEAQACYSSGLIGRRRKLPVRTGRRQRPDRAPPQSAGPFLSSFTAPKRRVSWRSRWPDLCGIALACSPPPLSTLVLFTMQPTPQRPPHFTVRPLLGLDRTAPCLATAAR